MNRKYIIVAFLLLYLTMGLGIWGEIEIRGEIETFHQGQFSTDCTGIQNCVSVQEDDFLIGIPEVNRGDGITITVDLSDLGNRKANVTINHMVSTFLNPQDCLCSPQEHQQVTDMVVEEITLGDRLFPSVLLSIDVEADIGTTDVRLPFDISITPVLKLSHLMEPLRYVLLPVMIYIGVKVIRETS